MIKVWRRTIKIKNIKATVSEKASDFFTNALSIRSHIVCKDESDGKNGYHRQKVCKVPKTRVCSMCICKVDKTTMEK